MQRHDNLIGGEWTKAAAYSPNKNPSNLGDTIAEYAQGDAAQVEAAVAAATSAFPAWATGSIQARSEALDRIGTEILARCIQHETDHLDGVLFIDRQRPEQQRVLLSTIRAAAWYDGLPEPAVKFSPH